jgi:hypothetical protein
MGGYMENSTISESSDTKNIVTIIGFGVSIVGSFFTCLTAILAITYVVIKSKFKDKQNTDVEIITKTGGREAKIKISLLNDETYEIDKKSFDNKKKPIDSKRQSEKTEEIAISKEDFDKEDLSVVLENNHQGDKIIASTRKDVIMHALNTFIKVDQINAMLHGAEDTLKISMLHKSGRKKLNKDDKQKQHEKDLEQKIEMIHKDSVTETEEIETSPELLGNGSKNDISDA